MRKQLFPLATALAVTLAACADSAPLEIDAAKERAGAAAKRLGSTLLTELTSALEKGEPADALHLCADIAQQVSADIAAEKGVTVGRTALRVRNPANAPDEFETAVLERWATTEGDLAPHVEVVDDELRWMKPIRLVGLCTTCHGSPEEIPEPVRTALAERYPEDAATGFAVGDLRGAFTVRVPLE